MVRDFFVVSFRDFFLMLYDKGNVLTLAFFNLYTPNAAATNSNSATSVSIGAPVPGGGGPGGGGGGGGPCAELFNTDSPMISVNSSSSFFTFCLLFCKYYPFGVGVFFK